MNNQLEIAVRQASQVPIGLTKEEQERHKEELNTLGVVDTDKLAETFYFKEASKTALV